MDMGEILGALLNKKSGDGGSVGSILGDLLGGGSKKAAAAPPRREAAPSRTTHRHHDDDLGSLVRDAHSKYQRRRGGSPQSHHREPERSSELDDERAKLLVRAMVNAAKADGQLDQAEQDSILGQLGEVTEEEIAFLRAEFAAPLDVRNFTWSVPLGLEQQVYGFSLMAIGLDEKKEARYLKELAHGLRLQPDACNQIHKQFGAPAIYR